MAKPIKKTNTGISTEKSGQQISNIFESFDLTDSISEQNLISEHSKIVEAQSMLNSYKKEKQQENSLSDRGCFC